MQGIVKNIFTLNHCWMRGDENDRWLLVKMGLAIQMHQLQAHKNGRSTWNIKEQVSSVPDSINNRNSSYSKIDGRAISDHCHLFFENLD